MGPIVGGVSSSALLTDISRAIDCWVEAPVSGKCSVDK